MTAFDEKYWNLAQAAAWVEFRERGLVEYFKTADRNSYMALNLYPTMWPAGRKRIGQIAELERFLVDERLQSWGYRKTNQTEIFEIPSAEWADFVIRPPVAWVEGQSTEHGQPWVKIRVFSADMKRLWRSPLEVSGRSQFDWKEIKSIYQEVLSQNQEMSTNELIIETQGAFEDRYNKKAPSRSSIQAKIKTWSYLGK